MANFELGGKNVHGQILMARAGTPFEIGLWGPLDIYVEPPVELTVSASNPVVTCTAGALQGRVRKYTINGLPQGQTTIWAKEPGGAVWTMVIIDAGPAGGTHYTNSPAEVPVTRTTPTIREVVDMVLAAWPALTEAGARTLAAQSMAETGDWVHCYNWNLGNVKCPNTTDRHMYLSGVWEVYNSQEAAQAAADAAGSLGHVATDAEIASHKWPTGKPIVVFNPPRPECRFRAYTSLREGAEKWISHHQGIAAKYPDYVANLNAGNVDQVAHEMKLSGYYSATEASYATAMRGKLAVVNTELGPVTGPGAGGIQGIPNSDSAEPLIQTP